MFQSPPTRLPIHDAYNRSLWITINRWMLYHINRSFTFIIGLVSGNMIITYNDTLLLFNIAMENPRTKWWFIAGKIIYFYGPFSMAMLNYQMVNELYQRSHATTSGLVLLHRRVPFGHQTGTAHVVDDQVPPGTSRTGRRCSGGETRWKTLGKWWFMVV